VNVSPDGSGDITSNDFAGGTTPAAYPADYTCSTTYTMTAVPDTAAGYTFDFWTVQTNTATTIYTVNPLTVSIGSVNKTVTAHFIKAADTVSLYYPHVTTRSPWQTEIALINTSAGQTIQGRLKGFTDAGQLIEIMDLTLAPRGRKQLTIATAFAYHATIGYIVFQTDAAGVQGYTKFYQTGTYRTAIPAVDEINTGTIYVPHIASNSSYWTGFSLVNTNATAKTLTLNFNDGRQASQTINAGEHKIFTIAGLFGGQSQPAIKSAEISNAGGIIGLALFGTPTALDGFLLTDDTVSTIYYPHVADPATWWTGIVAYNPSNIAGEITITPYTADGVALTTSALPIDGKAKYFGEVSNLDLPAGTAWFKLTSTRPLNGFELFGTWDSQRMAAYAEGSGSGARQGVFVKLEKSGWTGIAFVNTEAEAAAVTLTAYNDSGNVVAQNNFNVDGHAKMVKIAEQFFTPQSIANATYIGFVSDKTVVGFQLNNSADNKMLDGLPALY
jgi:hypothetical protein